jgi:amino acid transporter
MREPRVATAKRTMLYMASSLAITAGGILFCYLLLNCSPEEGKTLNATLIERLGFGEWFVVLSLMAEGGLLLVAAQTGFIDGPRVMANMSLDGWLPNRFSAFSERLTTHYGVLLIGGAALLSLFYTRGDVTVLVTMYSINVFVTFSLSQLGMCRFWLQEHRQQHSSWKRAFLLHGVALVLCVFILVMVVAAKFTEGAWMTLLVTSALIALCWFIRNHYRGVRARVRQLSEILDDLPKSSHPVPATTPLDPAQPTAAILVASYSGLGVHSLLAVMRTFPKHYKQVVFVSVAVLDSGNFKGAEEAVHLEAKVRADLEKYCEVARGLGVPATFRLADGIDPVAEAVKLCNKIGDEFPHAVFFGGKLVFQRETWWNRVLHNETAFAIQRRLQWLGRPMLVMPVRVGE